MGSGLALIRPCFEALARGLWLLRGCNDVQFDHYCQGRDTKRVEQLLNDLRKGPSAKEDAYLRETWDRSETSLHKFTHASYQLLMRRIQDDMVELAVDHSEIAEAARFTSGTAMLATVELARLAKSADVERRAMNLLAFLYPDTLVGGG